MQNIKRLLARLIPRRKRREAQRPLPLSDGPSVDEVFGPPKQ